MATIKLPRVHTFRKGGRTYHYFRPRIGPKLRLPGAPGSAEFMGAYDAALRGESAQPAQSRTIPGSMSALAVEFYRSRRFTALKPQSQRSYRRLLERFLADHGNKPVAMVEPRHLLKIITAMGETPAQANATRNVLRLLFQLAFDRGMRRDHPMRDVAKVAYTKQPYMTWREEHIAQFRAKHPTGTRARLTLELLLCTGQRRGDVIRLGPQHLRDGAMRVTQQKTGTDLLIPVHPDLAAELGATGGALVFLTTQSGAPFASGTAFYNRFKAWCEDAGLPAGLSPHGLRKATARRLAEAGCTPHEIGSITGHKTLAEIERYTRAAEQPRLAQSAIVRMVRPVDRS